MKINKGFTLIELLVVISIIGLLSSVVLASVNTARSRSRDSQRIQNLKQLQNALEIYRLTNGGYPPTPHWYGNSPTACSGATDNPIWYTNTASWIPGLVPTYISSLPVEPRANACATYLYMSNGVGYKLLSNGTIENYNPSYPLADPGWGGAGPTCTNPRGSSYSVYTSDYRCQ
jgi:type II secretion system protein G